MNLQRMPIMIESASADCEAMINVLTACLWESLFWKWKMKLMMEHLGAVSQKGLLIVYKEWVM